MGDKLPILKARDIMRVLERLEFIKVRQKGSHIFYKHADGRSTVIPLHRGEDIGRGLMRQILRDMEISADEFRKLI